MMLLAAALVAAAATASGAYANANTFLTGSFLATIFYDDVYEDAYCLNTGLPATSQRIGRWRAAPQCQLARISVEHVFGDAPQLGLRFGDLSGVSSAWVELGSPADIIEDPKYNFNGTQPADIYASLRFVDGKFVFDGIADVDRPSLNPLTDKSEHLPVPVKQGKIYLVRTTLPGKEVTDKLGENNGLLVKLLVVEVTDSHVVVRWNVLYTANYSLPTNPYEEPIGTTALGFAMFTFFFVLVVFACMCCRLCMKKRKSKRYAKLEKRAGIAEVDHDSDSHGA